MRNWQLEIGTYPGILLGIRTYNDKNYDEHVLYIPLFELILTIYKDEHTD